ncbi:MAG TPA: hypothetical protein VK557_00430 [Pyrinomonadaceae bacterium]|nr:hypothetical protein [Pyrinomonadaceae bacterium]
MKKATVALMISSFWIAASMTAPAGARAQTPPEFSRPVLFFEVLDLPARIDEPKLEKKTNQYVLSCALANRSGEQLVGLRLTLLVVESNGRTVSRAATDFVGH